MCSAMNARDRFRQGLVVRYPAREQNKEETSKENRDHANLVEHPKLIRSECVSRKRSLSPTSRVDDQVDTKLFVHNLLSQNDVYTQNFSTPQRKVIPLPESSHKIGIEDLACPSQISCSKTPRKCRVPRNGIDSALKQLHQKRDVMFGSCPGVRSQSVSRIAMPVTQQTPWSTMLHPTFQSMQATKHNQQPGNTHSCNPATSLPTFPAPGKLTSASHQQHTDFALDKLSQPGSYPHRKLQRNMFSQSAKREHPQLELFSPRVVQPATSSPLSHRSRDSKMSSSFGLDQFSPIMGSLDRMTQPTQPSVQSQDTSWSSHGSSDHYWKGQHTRHMNLEYDLHKQSPAVDHQWDQSTSPLQSKESTRLFQQQHQLFPQFIQRNDSKSSHELQQQPDESWTQFSSKFQNTRKRKRESPERSICNVKSFSYFGMSDDEDDKPKSLWSLIGESPKQKQAPMHTQPVHTPRRKLRKDLFDSNNWFHVSPLYTSTPVKNITEENGTPMDQSPVRKKLDSNGITERTMDDLSDGEHDINEVLTEACFITPRNSSIPKFRSLNNTLTPDSCVKNITTDLTSCCEETYNTTCDNEHETTNAETTMDCVTPKKLTSKQITDFFQHVEAKSTPPLPPAANRAMLKKTPSFTPYLSPIEETSSTDVVYDRVLEKKVESSLTLVEEE